MNKRKNVFTIILLIVAVFISLFAFTYIPQRLITIQPEEVSKIEIFNGSSGDAITLTNENEMDSIISNLNQIKFQKGNWSFFYLGYQYRLTIFDQKENEQFKFIINSDDTIRYRGFFYHDKTESINIEYIDQLFEQ